jgi:hypothetical protein
MSGDPLVPPGHLAAETATQPGTGVSLPSSDACVVVQLTSKYTSHVQEPHGRSPTQYTAMSADEGSASANGAMGAPTHAGGTEIERCTLASLTSPNNSGKAADAAHISSQSLNEGTARLSEGKVYVLSSIRTPRLPDHEENIPLPNPANHD